MFIFRSSSAIFKIKTWCLIFWKIQLSPCKFFMYSSSPKKTPRAGQVLDVFSSLSIFWPTCPKYQLHICLNYKYSQNVFFIRYDFQCWVQVPISMMLLLWFPCWGVSVIPDRLPQFYLCIVILAKISISNEPKIYYVLFKMSKLKMMIDFKKSFVLFEEIPKYLQNRCF